MCVLNARPQCASSIAVSICVLNLRLQCAVRPQYASSMCVLTERPQFASSMCVLNCCPQCASSMSSSLYVLTVRPQFASSIKRMHVFISFSSIYTYTIHRYMYIHICLYIYLKKCLLLFNVYLQRVNLLVPKLWPEKN